MVHGQPSPPNILNLVMDVIADHGTMERGPWSITSAENKFSYRGYRRFHAITSQYFWDLYVEKTPQPKSIISNVVPLFGQDLG